MGHSLLDEQLQEMQPYLIKWFKQYNVMMVDSRYKANKYEVITDNISFDSLFLTCQGYMYSIHSAFKELLKSYYYSVSADLIEKELRKKNEIGWSNYWKYEIKHYYFRNVISNYFSILDYIAVMVNELAQQQLIKDVRAVTFNKINTVLSNLKNQDNVGWMCAKDIKNIKTILPLAYTDITHAEKKILKPYRNRLTHRYLVGIDEMTVFTHREKVTEEDKDLYGRKDKFKYKVKANPEFTYDELKAIAEKLINNLDIMLYELTNLKIIRYQSIIKKIQ